MIKQIGILMVVAGFLTAASSLTYLMYLLNPIAGLVIGSVFVGLIGLGLVSN